MGKTNWKDSIILKILSNEIYKGDFVHDKRTNNPTYYENVYYYYQCHDCKITIREKILKRNLIILLKTFKNMIQ